MTLFRHDYCKDTNPITYITQALGAIKLNPVRYAREFKYCTALHHFDSAVLFSTINYLKIRCSFFAGRVAAWR